MNVNAKDKKKSVYSNIHWMPCNRINNINMLNSEPKKLATANIHILYIVRYSAMQAKAKHKYYKT